MQRFSGRIAVVTGASSGIGARIAEDLVRAGMVVVGAARRKDRLDSLAASLKGLEGRLVPLQADLSNVDNVRQLFKWVDDNLGGISVMVNNAAMLTNVPLQDQDPSVSEKIVFTNVTAVMICCTLAVESMKKHGIKDGHIININSVVGHSITNLPQGSITAYTTTKHATIALGRSLRLDLAKLEGFKIRLTSVSPGTVDTEMVPDQHKEKIGENILNVKAVSDAVIYVLSCPPNVEITELKIQPTGELFP